MPGARESSHFVRKEAEFSMETSAILRLDLSPLCSVTRDLLLLTIAVYCAHPPRVQHGSHNGPAEAAMFPLETVLKYTCYPGYLAVLYTVLYRYTCYPGYLAVGFAHAKCFLYNTTAQWFGPDLTCKREY